MGVVTPNHSGLPIVEIPLRDHRESTRSGASSSTAAST